VTFEKYVADRRQYIATLVLQARLDEANGLLGECIKWYRFPERIAIRIRAFLSRAPAQPADCPACWHPESRHCGAIDCPQPSAPEPAPVRVECRCGAVYITYTCPECRSAPAAPEPKRKPSGSVCRAMFDQWKERAESAEAQLAAVRAVLRDGTLTRHRLQIALLAQPTHGSGTGET
jgi:hypothetical protein